MDSFDIQMKAFTKKTEKKIETASRKIALELFRDVVFDTPVDQGRARGNWQVEINKYADDVIENKDLTGNGVVNEVSKKVTKFNMGDYITLVNNLPYIRRLEYSGWSKQAPRGMVRVNVKRAKKIASKIARSLNRK